MSEPLGDERHTSIEAPDAAGLFRIYPGNGVPPGSENWTWSERTTVTPWAPGSGQRMARNVVVPTLTMFSPAPGTANGTALIIAPGGAFHFLMIDHAYEIARALAAIGVTAFVLKYRVMRTPDDDAEIIDFRNRLMPPLIAARHANPPGDGPVTLEARLLGEEDCRQAIRFVRERAAEWGIDPQRIGIGGLSAGGALAVGAALEHDAAGRPDFACIAYPPLRFLPVPAEAPPLFLVISDDDKSVPADSAARLYEAWHKAGVPAEFHVFGNGGHGWGIGPEGHLSDVWMTLFKNWLAARGLLPKSG